MKLILLSLFFLAPVITKSQSIIKLSSKRNSDNSVDILYENKSYATYTIVIDFTQLTNSTCLTKSFTTKGLRGKLTTLKPITPSKSISYNYSYTYTMGQVVRKIDDDFKYLLPIDSSTTTSVHLMNNVSKKYFNKKAPENWIAFAFTLERGDSTYAARKGRVVKVVDENELQHEIHYSYNSSANYVIVEHSDGTLAKYSGFAKKNIFVKEGETITPHQFLGKIEQYSTENSKAQLRFSVYHLKKGQQLRVEKKLNKESPYRYVNPSFVTNKGVGKLLSGETYQGKISEELITQEFSKREKKKWIAKQLN